MPTGTSRLPENVDIFADPTPLTPMNDPVLSHSAMHSHVNDALTAIEPAVVGITAGPDQDGGLATHAAVKARTANCLLWDGNPKSVFHGQFWLPGVPLGQFLWEFLVRYDGSNGYLISEGTGGNHGLLYGIQGAPTGNMYNGTATTSFGGDYQCQIGEWLHTAVGWDGSWIYLWVNGCIAGMAQFAGPRQTGAGSLGNAGTLFLGGSNHSNHLGAIAAVRGFEYPAGGPSMPLMPNAASALSAYVPDLACSPFVVNGSLSGIPAQFAVSFMDRFGQTVEDKGRGYGGATHPGALIGYPNLNNSSPPQPAYDPVLAALFSAAWPPTQNRTPPTPAAVPSGAKIFDSFARKDTTGPWVFQPGGKPAYTLGNTEGGSLGPQPWTLTNAQAPWGIFNGRAVMCGNTSVANGVYVQNNSGDMDVQVTRANAPGYNPTSGTQVGTPADTGLLFRGQDASNFWLAAPLHDQFGNNYVNIETNIAGTVTSVVHWNFPNYTWRTLRIVTSGTTITGYVDNGGTGWTQIGQLTSQSQFQTATGVGMFISGAGGTAVRFSNFTVF